MVIDNVAKHMPADGSVWITNNTKYHNAFNGGEENRIHLVFVLDYKFDLKKIFISSDHADLTTKSQL